MDIKIKVIIDEKEKRAIAREVLEDLPEWFGIQESTEAYIKNSAKKPFLACFVDHQVAGFIVLKASSKDCAEIFVMGVKKKFHRMGLGTNLLHAYEIKAKACGYTYSQVKTVKMGKYQEYDRTNLFYQARGYCELECFPALWDEENPCQIYVKYLKALTSK